MHKLLILSAQANDYLHLIQATRLPELEIIATTEPLEAMSQCSDCDLAFGEPALLSQVVPYLSSLSWIQSTWAGVEPLLSPSLRHDYLLTNARGIFGRLMSEYVFGYLLSHERKILQRFASQQTGDWDETPPGTLRDKKLGLLGVGSIGAELARTAKHFSMHVRGYTRTSETCQYVDAYFHPPKKMAFANGLDYLVCILPQIDSTRQIVDRLLLSSLPSHAIIINVGRGSAMDEAALVEALQTGNIAGAILDVFHEEPLPPDHIFWKTPNLLITSHTAAPTVPEDIVGVFIANYHHLLRGETLQYQVDFDRGY